jgi:hypothetical protein
MKIGQAVSEEFNNKHCDWKILYLKTYIHINIYSYIIDKLKKNTSIYQF